MLKPWLIYHPVRVNNHAHFYLSGKELFDKIETLIRQAKQIIHIQFYIFDEDLIGSRIINTLLDASLRGVSVWLVVDGYASDKITSNTILKLKSAGVHFKKFSPVKTSKFRIGRRMHHKIFMVDNETALIGGMNIADKYHGSDKHEPWLDFGVIVNGSVCDDIRIICESIWRKNDIALMRAMIPINKTQVTGNITLQLLQNDWWRRRIEISSSYRESIRNAQEELIIVASYFFPNNRMKRLLKKAALRGVRIKILTVSNSDIVLLGPALRYLYDWLLRNKIEIYEWQPSIMHGKLMLTDNATCNIGSYNLNALSDYGSIELNVLIKDKTFTKEVKLKLNELILKGCKNVSCEDFKIKNSVFVRLYRWLCYQTFRFALKVLFVFMQRSRFSKATSN